MPGTDFENDIPQLCKYRQCGQQTLPEKVGHPDKGLGHVFDGTVTTESRHLGCAEIDFFRVPSPLEKGRPHHPSRY